MTIKVAPPSYRDPLVPGSIDRSDLWRLSTVERESNCLRALFLVRSTLTVPYDADFRI